MDFKKLRIGNTNLIKFEPTSIDKTINKNIFGKLEIYNPTGSHKDRESLELVSYCLKKGFREIGCASTGNFGISLAYLSNIYNLKCHVWVSNDISPFRESYLESFGANIHKLKGDLNDIYDYSSREMKINGIFDGNPGGNNIKINANKSIFNELIRDLPDVNKIITCINNGTHYLGLSTAAQAFKIPVHAVYTFDKRAKSISGFGSYEGRDKIQKMIAMNKGSLIEANGKDINLGLQHAKENGLIIESSSAAVVGVALNLSSSNEKTCCIITGNGLKYPEEI